MRTTGEVICIARTNAIDSFLLRIRHNSELRAEQGIWVRVIKDSDLHDIADKLKRDSEKFKEANP